MSSLFGPRRGRVKPPKRNRFDMSHQHLNTTDFGLVKPFFCKEVIGGDSVSLDPVCAIRSHPIVFPINTRMRMYAHYFYVRNRTLWKDWENFIFKTKEGLTPPFLQLTPERAKKMIGTGSLGDCLGVPSTYIPAGQAYEDISVDYHTNYGTGATFLLSRSQSLSAQLATLVNEGTPFVDNNSATFRRDSLGVGYLTSDLSHVYSFKEFDSLPFQSTFSGTPSRPNNMRVIVCYRKNNKLYPYSSSVFDLEISYTESDGTFINHYSIPRYDILTEKCQSCIDSKGSYCLFFLSVEDELYQASPSYYSLIDNPPFFALTPTSAYLIPSKINLPVYVDSIIDATDPAYVNNNPFVGPTPRIPLSALPFRACEMISNYFFRNDQNNPYILNGEAQYNQFIPTTDGGPDTNEYLIHHRNWEFDAYTSAVPSPQFGAAPLVGVTYAGGREAELTFQGSDSDGVVQDYKVKVGLADDGVIQSVIDFDKGVPSGSLRELIDLSSVGISINDLRNVNAYQRFKENCLRRSLRYRDQMLSHLGVNVDYPDIDVPQFIGGFSGDLVVSPVTNMAETDSAMLGDVAGKIESVIKSNHRITCYCPEHGFIIGMFSIVPIPTYSQLLPKSFTRYDAFDYFQSEFGKIGYVPIFHRELFPLQSLDPDKVFGYQRAWYDYMSSPDEVHGDFRTSLADFVLYRTFKEEPSLNEDFTTVQSDSLNNIFAVDKVDEKYKNSEHFMVQFYHDAVFKRPIPKYGMPSLE